jgi:two-component system sensor histidine kinase UhpB
MNPIGLPTRLRPEHRVRRQAVADLAVVMLATLAVFGVASRIELHEHLTQWLAGYERWQLDEAALTLFALALGLAWFAWRRMRALEREAASRLRAESERERLALRNRELSQRLMLLQEEERAAIARELHDEVGQACVAIRAEVACLRPRPDQAAPADAIAATADALHGTVRNLLRRLRPGTLDSAGLDAALEELCSDWSRRHGVECSLSLAGNARNLDRKIAIAVYRIAQECLANVARHAQASWVRASLECDARSLLLSVQDNGRGLAADARQQGFGLLGMEERAAALGGRLHLVTEQVQGLRVELRIPLGHDAP